MTATLRYATFPDHPEVRRLVLYCRHGTTYADLIDPAPSILTDRAVVRIIVARHEMEEGCGCARGLDTLALSREGRA